MRPVTPLALIVVLASACTEDPATTTDGASSSGSSTGNVATTDPSTDPTVAPTTDPTTGDPSGSTAAPTTGVGTTTVDTTGDTGDTTGDTTSPVDSSTGDSTSGSSTGESTGSTGMVDLCANGELDQDETDIDCGGATCAGCQDGQVCLANEDCVSVVCTGGLCVTPECLADADCAGLDDACNTGTCDLVAFACVKTPAMDATMCDDGDLCTGASACLAGACVGSDLTDCSGLNSLCGTGVCDPLTGTCGVEPDKDAEGMACDDQNNCTANTVCTAGSCGDPNNKGYAFYEPFLDNSAAWTLPESWEIKAAAVSPGGWNGADPAMDHTATDDNGVAGQFVGGLVTSNNTTTGDRPRRASPGMYAHCCRIIDERLPPREAPTPRAPAARRASRAPDWRRHPWPCASDQRGRRLERHRLLQGGAAGRSRGGAARGDVLAAVGTREQFLKVRLLR
jgi:hypothetical protein